MWLPPLVLWPRVTRAAVVRLTPRRGTQVKLLTWSDVANVVTVPMFTAPMTVRIVTPFSRIAVRRTVSV